MLPPVAIPNKDLSQESEITVPLRKNLSQTPSLSKPLRRALESSKRSAAEPNLIPFRISIDHVFNVIKDQPWIRRLSRPLPQNLKGHGSRDYCAFHDRRDHLIVNCRTLRYHLQDLVKERFSESSSSTLDSPWRL